MKYTSKTLSRLINQIKIDFRKGCKKIIKDIQSDIIKEVLPVLEANGAENINTTNRAIAYSGAATVQAQFSDEITEERMEQIDQSVRSKLNGALHSWNNMKKPE